MNIIRKLRNESSEVFISDIHLLLSAMSRTALTRVAGASSTTLEGPTGSTASAVSSTNAGPIVGSAVVRTTAGLSSRASSRAAGGHNSQEEFRRSEKLKKDTWFRSTGEETPEMDDLTSFGWRFIYMKIKRFWCKT